MAMLELGRYKHYKGRLYEVICIGKLEANLEDVVIYKSLYEDSDFPKGTIWVRPLSSFTETIKLKENRIKRFEKVD